MNGRVYDPELGRFLSADPHVQHPKEAQSYNRYSYVQNNPLRYTDPSGYFLKKMFKSVGEFFNTDIGKVVGIGLAIWGGYAAYQAAASSAMMGTTACFASTAPSVVSAGLAAGGAAFGAIAGSAYGVSQTGTFEGFLRGGLGGTMAGYSLGGMAGGFYSSAMAEGTWGVTKSLGHHAISHKTREEVKEYAAKRGLSLTELNLGLMGLSFLGNSLVNDRLELNNDGVVEIHGVSFRGPQGLFFDAVDIILGYQGLPTATAFQYMFNYRGLPIISHSLGTLDATNLAGLGFTRGSFVEVNSLPALNIAPGGVRTRLNGGDFVNGSFINLILNPDAEFLMIGPEPNAYNLFGHGSCGVYGRFCSP